METPLPTVLFTTSPFRLPSVCETATATKIDPTTHIVVIPTLHRFAMGVDVVVVTKSAVVSHHTIQYNNSLPFWPSPSPSPSYI
jgi:hypothetical protein